MLIDHVERRIANDAAVGALLGRATLPVTRCKPFQGATKARWFHESDVVGLQSLLAGRVERQGRRGERVLLAPLLTSLCFRFSRVVGI